MIKKNLDFSLLTHRGSPDSLDDSCKARLKTTGNVCGTLSIMGNVFILYASGIKHHRNIINEMFLYFLCLHQPFYLLRRYLSFIQYQLSNWLGCSCTSDLLSVIRVQIEETIVSVYSESNDSWSHQVSHQTCITENKKCKVYLLIPLYVWLLDANAISCLVLDILMTTKKKILFLCFSICLPQLPRKSCTFSSHLRSLLQ